MLRANGKSPWLTDLGLLVLRLGTGALMLGGHGLGKFARLTADPVVFSDPLGVGPTASLALAILGEVVGSTLILLGLGTRIGALLLITTMGVAAFVVHAADPWPRQELALLYALPALALLFTGPGRLSLDHVLRQRRARRAHARLR